MTLTSQVFAGIEKPAGRAGNMRVAALVEAERYRTLAQRAIHTLHDLAAERDQLRDRYHRTLDEARALRGKLRRYTASAVGSAA